MPAAAKLPFDVDPAASDQTWAHGRPFRLVLRFADSTYYQNFHDAWIIYKWGLYQCKWEMICAEKDDRTQTVNAFLYARSPVLASQSKSVSTPKKGPLSRQAIVGTGTGNTYGSSSPPPPPQPVKGGGKARARKATPFHNLEILKLTVLEDF